MLQVKINDIVQITNLKHKWFSCLIIVDKIKNSGCRGYITIPHKGEAFIRLNHEDYKIVGETLISLLETSNAPS